MQACGLKQKKIIGDGNCLFRAIADQLENLHKQQGVDHKTLREMAVKWLQSDSNSEVVVEAAFYEPNKQTYLRRMTKDAEWGDHIVISALANALNLRIVIFQIMNGAVIVVEPDSRVVHKSSSATTRDIFITFEPEVHFDSTEPVVKGTRPTCDPNKIANKNWRPSEKGSSGKSTKRKQSTLATSRSNKEKSVDAFGGREPLMVVPMLILGGVLLVIYSVVQ